MAWHLARDGTAVLVAPGNPGTPERRAVPLTDIDGLVALARSEAVDLTIVGPEAPLAAGLVDRFLSEGLKVFGPTRAAARLEWSKAWTKDFLRRQGVPTAAAQVVDSEAAARKAIHRMGLPLVLKADGLAAGKGVFVVRTQPEVDGALEQLFQHLGAAATEVLVEECLEGAELSVLAFSDGERLEVMPPARDYKRLCDRDVGPNTGGMGGYARPGDVSTELLQDVQALVLQPTIEAMAREGHPYRGVLYAGLMLTGDGPKVLEFNCRFGDPECQLILPLLESNLAEVCTAVASDGLNSVSWKEGRTYAVVLASAGYPEKPRSGDAITGLDTLDAGVLAFHAGTRLDDDGRLVTAGGRVLTLVSSDREAVYRAARSVNFDGKQFRTDIGLEVSATMEAHR
jgi:phosphoribosylamine---glycine ligase